MKPEVKIRLIEKLIHTEDDEILMQIQDILDNHNTVLGSRPDGTPVTKQDIIDRVDKAQEDLNQGRVISHSQVLEHFNKKFTK